MARIVAIYAAPQAGAEPISQTEAVIEAGRGIIGDRYCRRQGTFSEKLRDSHDWHITLIEVEEINASMRHSVPVTTPAISAATSSPRESA